MDRSFAPIGLERTDRVPTFGSLSPTTMQLRHLLFATALGSTAHTLAQAPTWAHALGSTQADFAYDVAIGLNGMVITVGTFTLTVDLDPGPGTFNVTSNGSNDVFVQALDSAGGFLWGGSIGAGGADWAFGVATNTGGEVYLTGRASGTVDLDPGPGVDLRTSANTSFDVFVVKLDAQGTYLWGHLIGGNGTDVGNDISVDASGRVLVCGVLGAAGDLDPGPGVATAGGNGQQDAFVLKLDPAGQFVWGFAVGGTGNDQAFGVAADALDDVLLCGEFRNTVDFDPGAAVLSRTSAGIEDAFVMKVSSGGAVLWAASFSGTSSERAQALDVGPDGGPVITGRISSSTDFDPGPGSFPLAGDFSEPAFVAKLNSDGTFAWAFMLKSFLNEGFDVDVDAQGAAHVTGTFGNTTGNPLDLDPGAGVSTIASNGAADVFVASYSAAGTFLQGFNLGGAQNDVGRGVAVGADGRIHVTGAFLGTFDADPGANTLLLVSAGSTEAFTVQFEKPDCAGVFVRLKAILGAVHTPADFLAMSDQLRTAGLIPLEEPYTAMGFTLEQPAVTTPLVLGWTLSSAIVDWVLVELRDPVDPTQVLARRAALLQRDGDVVGVDGVAPVGFCRFPGDYHVALRHRNHLGVMTAAPVSLGSTPLTIDLTLPGTLVFGTDARRDVNGTQVLWPNNTRFDNTVKYTGAANDRDAILVRIGGIIPTATVAGYWPEDANMDGVVKYTGSANDRDPILMTIGPPLPTGTRTEQLP
ncbi:MAG: hypothetical protein IPM49_10390 [Flavobacteriales bacterium]|nr:hypothetical protein [Flavobacteriales bacterium]